MKTELINQIVLDEIKGKNDAIHAYNKMIWTIRSGYLTLVFAGWGLAVKAAIETNKTIETILPYIFLLSAFTVALAIGAYIADRNYIMKKYRVVTALNQLVEFILTHDLIKIKGKITNNLVNLLHVSGDNDNISIETTSYQKEIFVLSTIYFIPSILSVLVSLVCLFIHS